MSFVGLCEISPRLFLADRSQLAMGGGCGRLGLALALVAWVPAAHGMGLATVGGNPVRPRTVRVVDGLEVTVLELARPQELVESWASAPGSGLDPFGLVVWPGAQFASRLLAEEPAAVEGADVLVLGVGTGLEALAAAALGAARVTAVDIHPLPLALLRDAAALSGHADVVRTHRFDLASAEPLPRGHDVHLYADVLYAGELAEHVARRCAEALAGEEPPRRLLVTDSQQFAAAGRFLDALNAATPPSGPPLEWQTATVRGFTGSGLLLDEDQTYDATVRYLDLRDGRAK
jgi:predicted nicotinamide N-methyase